MRDVRCPQCSSPMRAEPALEQRAIVKAKVEAGSSAAYATNFAASHHEKEVALGIVHVCSSCRYVMRVKAAA